MCILWFWPKLLFSSGEVFSEQASRCQTSEVSLEAQNILEVPFKGLSSMCCVYFLWMCFLWFWPKLLLSSGEVCSEQVSRYQTNVESLEAQNIIEVPFKVPVQCVAFTLRECVFHDFDPKMLFSSGEVFSEHASRYQTTVVSLEAQNIIEWPFKGLGSTCCVNFVWMCISWFW